jgi:adenine-specific DNA-methyltransferase
MPDYPKVPQQISDPISENLAKLSELFPTAVKDGALDVEALRAELGDFEEIKPGDETYELNWVGKQSAKKEAFRPPLGKTLALKDDGKNIETTQNLYIEGDNLEALKLLRQNYYGEIKMIYIDPPYNTGNDFVYKDNFTAKLDESEREEGAVSEAGNRLIKNEKTSNRFHARWLDMIYPRLKIAKELLRDDGVIFISIDDNEVNNLRAVCDEVFNEGNFQASLVWQRKQSPQRDATNISTTHDTILVYSKRAPQNKNDHKGWLCRLLPKTGDQIERYKNPDNDPRGVWASTDCTINKTAEERPNLYYPITNPHTKEEIYPSKNRTWSFDRAAMARLLEENKIWWGENKKNFPRLKSFLSENQQGVRPQTLLLRTSVGDNQAATRELNSLFVEAGMIFDSPKPTTLIHHLCLIANTSSDDIILDFFSGSGTTAHAILKYNAEDGQKRRFIMVQLPEECEENSEAAKAGFKSIAEIGKERIRRAGDIIKNELKAKHAEWKKQQTLDSKKGGKLELDDGATEESNPYIIDPDALDIGFKSFRIEDTKINWLKKDLRGEQLEFSDTTTQDALDFVPGYTDTDVVYELMLRQSNIPLTGTITKPIAATKRTYLYADAYLICLEEKITQKLVESLAAIEPTPNKYFFRDSAFGTDIALKDETFRRLKAEIHKHHGDLGAAYTVEFI